jgi:tetratricopeptide (TPR) repeat protein
MLESLEPSHERFTLGVTLRSCQARSLTSMHGYSAEVEAAYERLLGSLEGVDVPQAYPVLRSLGTFYALRADHVRAADIGRQILALAEREGNPEIGVAGHLALGAALSFAGRIEDGVPELEAGVRLSRTRPIEAAPIHLGPDPRVATLTALALFSWWQGRLDGSLAYSEEALAMAELLRHPSTSGYALFHAALLQLWRGDLGVARDLAVRAVEVADEHDLHIWSAVGTVVLGASVTGLGNADEGMRWIAEGMDRYRGLRTPPIFWPFLLLDRALACLMAGRAADGLESADEALELAPRMSELHVVRGDLLHAAGRDAEAVVAYERGRLAAHDWGARLIELRAALRLCRLADGEPPATREARRNDLRSVYSAFDEGLESAELVESRLLLGDQT